jgi:hypothetical protein
MEQTLQLIFAKSSVMKNFFYKIDICSQDYKTFFFVIDDLAKVGYSVCPRNKHCNLFLPNHQ